MRLLISRRLPDSVMADAAAEFDLTARDGDAPMTEAEVTEALQSHDIVLPTLGDAVTAAAIAAAEPLRTRLVANFGVGYNHIDAGAAQAAGIAVTNTPGAVTDATADIAMMLILMTARRASEGEVLVRQGRWTGWHPTQLLGLHVTGRKLGIVGMGRIGQAIARRAHHGFGMEIVYANRSPRAVDIPGARQVVLPDLLAGSDIVVLAVPGGTETRHLIDDAALRRMPAHAHLVNISRGDVVDEAALGDALAGGRLAGAGLDVYEHEPAVPERLRCLPNVTLLPHLGTAALEVREAMGRMALDNARAARDGRPLPNPV